MNRQTDVILFRFQKIILLVDKWIPGKGSPNRSTKTNNKSIIIVQTGNDCGLKVNDIGDSPDKRMEYALKMKLKLFRVLIWSVKGKKDLTMTLRFWLDSLGLPWCSETGKLSKWNKLITGMFCSVHLHGVYLNKLHTP